MQVTQERKELITRAVTEAIDAHAEETDIDGFIVDAVVETLESFEHPPRKTVVANQAEKKASGVAIEYVGRREPYNDALYGTGVWSHTGAVKIVADAKAAQMIKHIDVYRVVELSQKETSEQDDVSEEDIVGKETDEEKANKEQAERVQNARDEILSMTKKQAIMDFVKTNNLPEMSELTDRSRLQEFKDAAIQRIDQYGLV